MSRPPSGEPGGVAPLDPLDPRRVDPGAPTWGLGDVAVGVVAAQVLSVLGLLVAAATLGWDDVDAIPLWGTALLQVPLWVGMLGAVAVAGRTKGGGIRHDFGLSMRWYDAPLGILAGVAVQLVVLPLLYVPLLVLLDRSAEDLGAPARELSARAEGAAGWVVLALIVVVGAPIVEELFYRGLVLRAFDKRGLPGWASVLATSALFAAVHFQPLQFMGLFVFGVILALLVRSTGRLGPAIWAHAAFNAATVVSLYLEAN